MLQKLVIRILFIFPHIFIRILFFIVIYFRLVSSLLVFALLNAGTSVTHCGQTDRFYCVACHVNQTVDGLDERSPADHEPITHCAVK